VSYVSAYGPKLDLSRLSAAPLVVFTAPKERDYGTYMNGRISQGCGVERWFETRSREWRPVLRGPKAMRFRFVHCPALGWKCPPFGRLLHIRLSVGGTCSNGTWLKRTLRAPRNRDRFKITSVTVSTSGMSENSSPAVVGIFCNNRS
jgi:hypothetical protein